MLKEKEVQNRQYRVITFLDREKLDFLDELEKDIFFSHGIHIPRTKLIEEIIQAFKSQNTKGVIVEDLIKRFKNKPESEKGKIG